MRLRTVFSVLALFAILFAEHSGAQTSARSVQPTPEQLAKMPVQALPVADFKLLSANTGWVSTGDRLLWTTDKGAHWKDISPPNPNADKFASVFFLDEETGWVLIPHSDNSEDWTFTVSFTLDGGTTWTKANLPERKYDREKGERGLVDQGIIAFATKQQGWLSLDVEGNTFFAYSILLSTSDGGRTWHHTPVCKNGVDNGPEGTIDAILALSEKDVWVTASPEGLSALYVSHNKGECFQQVSLTAPKESGSVNQPSHYAEPAFENVLHGFEAATFSDAKSGKSAAVLFETEDGGSTWRPDRTLSNLAQGETVESSVVQSTWILPYVSQETKPTLLKLRRNDRATAELPKGRGDFRTCKLGFHTPDEGWINCAGELSATVDGGVSWKTITPRVRNGVLTLDPVAPIRRLPVLRNSAQLSHAVTSDFHSIAPMDTAPGHIPYVRGIDQHLGLESMALFTMPTISKRQMRLT
jgi:photosystem II stability/assembly factor-like uncharacterized protein